MNEWPVIKTAADLVAEGIVPCSQDTLIRLAKVHGVGRKLGRAYVFTPADVRALLERLPCPSGSPADSGIRQSAAAGPSQASALSKALALATARPAKRRARA